MSRLSKPQNQQLTRNVDDKIKVVPTTKINKKWHNRTGAIISVHPTSGCYVVIIDET